MLVKSARSALAFAGLIAAASIAGAQGATVQGQSTKVDSSKVAQQGSAKAERAPTGHPFVKHPTSKEDLALAIESGKDGDMKLLNLGATRFAEAMNEIYPYLRLENRESLANHIRSMEVVLCPSGQARLSRLLGDKVDAKGWVREIHPGEQCLLNRKEGRIELSLWCGNPTPELFAAKPEVAAAPLPVPAAAPVRILSPDTTEVRYSGGVDVNVHGDVNTHGSTEKEGGRSALETTGLVIGGVALAAGATCGIMAIFHRYCFENINNNYNDGRQPSKDKGFGVDVLKLVQFVTDPKHALKHQ